MILLLDTAGHPGPAAFGASGRTGPTPQHLDENWRHFHPFLDPGFTCVLRKYPGPVCLLPMKATTPLLRGLPSCHQPLKIHVVVCPGFDNWTGVGNHRLEVGTIPSTNEQEYTVTGAVSAVKGAIDEGRARATNECDIHSVRMNR